MLVGAASPRHEVGTIAARNCFTPGQTPEVTNLCRMCAGFRAGPRSGLGVLSHGDARKPRLQPENGFGVQLRDP